MNAEAEKIIEFLDLEEHPEEGGFFRETYRGNLRITDTSVLPEGASSRSISTAIYYMLAGQSFSAMHSVASDEIFHFYKGDPVLMLQLFPDGSSREVVIGNDIAQGQQPQVLVPAGVWQGSMLIDDRGYALMGATVSPGFEYADYCNGVFTELSARYPEHIDLLRRLCIK